MKDADKENILEYLWIHKDHKLRLETIVEATKLDKQTVLNIMNELCEQDIVGYYLNQKSPKTQKILDEYDKRVAENLAEAYKRAK